jgi:hypothetical protein
MTAIFKHKVLSYDRSVHPGLRCENDGWYISFVWSNFKDVSFQIRIKHHYGYDSDEPGSNFKVIAMCEGEEEEVISRETYEQRLQDYMEHEGGTREEAENWYSTRTHWWIISDANFWKKVDEMADRWNAMLFLFAPTVTEC